MEKLDAVVLSLGVPVPALSPRVLLSDLKQYLKLGRTGRKRGEREINGKKILLYYAHIGNGVFWDFDPYLYAAKAVVGLGLFGLYSERKKAGDVFLPSSAIGLMPTRSESGYTILEERKPSLKLYNKLMESMERHGFKPYQGKVCTVYRPDHGHWRIDELEDCVGQEMETWFLFDEAEKAGVEAASVLLPSDVAARNIPEIRKQFSRGRKSLYSTYKRLFYEILPESLAAVV